MNKAPFVIRLTSRTSLVDASIVHLLLFVYRVLAERVLHGDKLAESVLERHEFLHCPMSGE